jgi:hypothetical protein
MRHSESRVGGGFRCADPPFERDKEGFDWRSWLTLGWVVVFGALYARMVLQERAPGAWEAIRGLVRLD